MNSYRTEIILSLGWIFTVGGAYAFGWWAGFQKAAHVAASAAQVGMSMMPGLLAVVAIGGAIAAYQARGYLSQYVSGPTPGQPQLN